MYISRMLTLALASEQEIKLQLQLQLNQAVGIRRDMFTLKELQSLLPFQANSLVLVSSHWLAQFSALNSYTQ